MIGRLVAIRIEDLDDSLGVTGLVAQPKNRKAAWRFEVPHADARSVPEKVKEMEQERNDQAKA